MKGKRVAQYCWSALAVLWAVLSLMACEMTVSDKPSVLVIAVDSLGANQLTCQSAGADYNVTSGFEEMCQDSVRFSHAFTPSTLAQPALISLLTGKYPLSHGVWHNGSQFLSAATKTVQEEAVREGYHTALFSGGPPIWKKSGVAQGFEVFDDLFVPEVGAIYQPAEKTMAHLLWWLDHRVGYRPFFSIVFLPDLQFVNSATRTDSGELRSKTFASQLAEVDESLGDLVSALKKRNRWDNTYVVLAGLNGYLEQRRKDDTVAVNLSGQNTQVALLFKPARKRRDAGIHWKVDTNVSLADVGATLYDIVGAVPSETQQTEKFKVISLLPALQKPQQIWPVDRPILIESSWSAWRFDSEPRLALRMGHYLYIHDNETKLYNTLIDPYEIHPMKPSDPMWSKVNGESQQLFTDLGFSPWANLDSKTLVKDKFARSIFGPRANQQEAKHDWLAHLKQWPDDAEMAHWLAWVALESEDWEYLEDVGKIYNQSLWKYVGRFHQKLKRPRLNDKCDQLFNSKELPTSHRPSEGCDDQLFVALLKWVFAEGKPAELAAQEDFLRQYGQQAISREIQMANNFNGNIWDVRVLDNEWPSRTDFYLTLPNAKKQRVIAERRFGEF